MDSISRDSVAALAIVDKIESAVRDDQTGSISDARDFIAGAMATPEGVVFVLQGIKAMLVWMQKEDDPDVSGATLADVWSLLNQHATNEHRRLLNEFQSGLYLDADSIRDWVRRASLNPEREIPPAMESLIGRICQIPRLEE